MARPSIGADRAPAWPGVRPGGSSPVRRLGAPGTAQAATPPGEGHWSTTPRRHRRRPAVPQYRPSGEILVPAHPYWYRSRCTTENATSEHVEDGALAVWIFNSREDAASRKVLYAGRRGPDPRVHRAPRRAAGVTSPADTGGSAGRAPPSAHAHGCVRSPSRRNAPRHRRVVRTAAAQAPREPQATRALTCAGMRIGTLNTRPGQADHGTNGGCAPSVPEESRVLRFRTPASSRIPDPGAPWSTFRLPLGAPG